MSFSFLSQLRRLGLGRVWIIVHSRLRDDLNQFCCIDKSVVCTAVKCKGKEGNERSTPVRNVSASHRGNFLLHTWPHLGLRCFCCWRRSNSISVFVLHFQFATRIHNILLARGTAHGRKKPLDFLAYWKRVQLPPCHHKLVFSQDGQA